MPARTQSCTRLLSQRHSVGIPHHAARTLASLLWVWGVISLLTRFFGGGRAFQPQRDKAHPIALFLLIALGSIVAPTYLRSQQITYTYDEAGRLVGVVDPSGNAASYKYDATGNILSIQRYTTSQVGIFDFTPNSGSLGLTVTLNGTGFSATASQNTVKFNGTTAVVSSSTPTQIITTVPSGATTGSITVTSPLGTATSSDQFVVSGASSASPFISSFTPVIANPSGTVTITGGNFASPAAANDVKVNIGLVSVNSASASSLSVNIPLNATSGRITVTTPAGQAVSSGDLFIPSSGHVVLSGSTGRMTIGSSADLSVPAGGYTGLMIFDATTPQRIFVVLSGNKGTSGLFNGLTATLFDPEGNAIGTPNQPGNTVGTSPTSVFINGTYTLEIQSQQVAVDPTITIYNVADSTSPISINGASVPVTISTPGQKANLTFSGIQNQQVTIAASNNTMYAGWSLTDPMGNNTYLVNLSQGYPSSSSPLTLPTTGTYTLTIDPGGVTGSVTASITSP
jgi:YD repeat-containing protein